MHRITRTHDRRDLSVEEMSATHLDGLHSLSTSMGWPHRKEDWATHMLAGSGVVAVDGIGRVHGSAMYFSVGQRKTALGMVIAHPRLRLSDIGKRLIDEVGEATCDLRTTLNACSGDVGFYRSIGAKSIGQVFQHEGSVRPCASHPSECSPATFTDFTDIMDLDLEANGDDRSTLISAISNVSKTIILRRHGRLVGYAMKRVFGRGYVIGPVVATLDDYAIALVDAFLSELHGRFVRVDTQVAGAKFRTYLVDRGLQQRQCVLQMELGQVSGPKSGMIYGLLSHSTG